MDGGEQHSVAINNNNELMEEGDCEDNLEPGYHFCPTDSELIVHFLKPKIETGKIPKCRIYEVNLYNYSPKELSSKYRGCRGNWYFLTPRFRKYPNGDRPNRKTKDGLWRTTQRHAEVYDDEDRELVVGHRRSLAYHGKNSRKTSWLMHEFTTEKPNLPIGNETLTSWVLCKIYNREKSQTDNNDDEEEQVPNTSNQSGEINEQNQPLDANEQPSPRRRRIISKVTQSSSVSSTGQTMLNATNSFRSSDGASTSTPTEPLPIAAVAPQLPADNMMATCLYPVNSPNFPNWNFAYVNSTGQTMLNATNSFRSSDGASTSTPTEPLPIAAVAPQPPTDNMMGTCPYPVTATNFPNWNFASVSSTGPTMLNATNSFRSFNGALSSTLAAPHAIAAAVPPQKPPTNNMMAPMCPYPVTSTNFPNWDVADNYIPQLNDMDATGALLDEGLMSFDHVKDHWFSLEEMFGPNWQQNFHP